MKMTMILAIFSAVFLFAACSKSEQKSELEVSGQDTAVTGTAKITFVELGSVNCMVCKSMQPVMQAVEQKYGEQISVIFYDIRKSGQERYAEQFGIRIIPTQVFLDAAGEEIMRHEGFFAEAEIDQFLQSQGLKVLQGS